MRREDRMDRRVLTWLARRLYAPRTAEPPGAGGPERVLVVRVDERVGNLVTVQSLLDALNAGLPHARLGLLASVRAAQVTRSLEGVSRLHELDKRWFFRRPASWHGAVQAVRQAGYQVAIDASAWHQFSFTHAALAYFSGAPVRIGTDRGVETGFHTHRIRPGPEDEHELAQRMRLLEPLGLTGPPPALRTTLGAEKLAVWENWLLSEGVPCPRIGIWAGSRKKERRWPPGFYARLGQALQARCSASLVILWGPGEERLRDELAGSFQQRRVVAPATGLDDLAGLLRRLDLVVTNDTGPMHLSVAVGRPTVALFASGTPSRWGHPYPYVRNLSTPGRDVSEVEEAARACEGLLRQSTASPLTAPTLRGR